MKKKVKISEICNRVIFYVVSDACLVHKSVVDHTGRMVDGYEFNPEKMLGVHLGFNIHYFWTLEEAKKYVVENNVEVILRESPKEDISRKGLNEQRIRVNDMDLPRVKISVMGVSVSDIIRPDLAALKPMHSSFDVIIDKLDEIIDKVDAGVFRKVVIDDILSSKEKAINFLNEVGICDKEGNLIYPYNRKRE